MLWNQKKNEEKNKDTHNRIILIRPLFSETCILVPIDFHVFGLNSMDMF